MKLTTEELIFYRENGYLIKYNLFDQSEVKQLKIAAENSVDAAKLFINNNMYGNKPYTIDGNRFVDLRYNGNTTVQFEHDKEKENNVVRVIEPIHHFDKTFEQLVDSKRLVEPMEQILGQVHGGVSLWTSKLNLKRPHGSAFQYHQDSPYWEYDCKHNVDLLPNVIVYFDDATLENGALHIVQKSHTKGVLPGRVNEDFEFPGFFTDKNSFNEQNAVPIIAKAGSVCFFNPHTVHGSMRNSTNQSRRAIILTYQPLNMPLLKNGRIRNCTQHHLYPHHHLSSTSTTGRRKNNSLQQQERTVKPNRTSASSSNDEDNENEAPTIELVKARRQGHSVPSTMRSNSGSAVTYFENTARKPTHAEKVQSLIESISKGTMSTIHHTNGYPYGSIINFARIGNDRIITFVSKLAEHYANIKKDPRASILVSVEQGEGDNLATARVTLLCDVEQVVKTDLEVHSFLNKHPKAYYIKFDDFHCLEFKVKTIRYIGGFGEMSWFGGNELIDSEPDPVVINGGGPDAVKHLNEDHHDAMILVAKAFSGLPSNDIDDVVVLSIDRYGMDILCSMTDGKRRSRVAFVKPLDVGDSNDMRLASIEITKAAREALDVNNNNNTSKL